MPVYDRSYRRWDGQLKRRALRFVPIVTMGVRNALAMKGGWFFTLLLRLFMVASLVPTLLLLFLNLALVYRFDWLPAEFFSRFLDRLRPFRAFQYPLLTAMNMKFLMFYTVLFGSGLIAKDRASGALPLYLARPLTLTDYILGKFGVIGWFVAMFTLVPNLLLWLLGVMADEGEHALRNALPQLPPILLLNAVVVVLYGITILAASSVCRRPMYAALLWISFVILLPNLTLIGRHLGWADLPAISPNDAIYSLGDELFDLTALSESAGSPERMALTGFLRFLRPFGSLSAYACWLSLGAWSGLSLAVVVGSLRRQDVVGESGTR